MWPTLDTYLRTQAFVYPEFRRKGVNILTNRLRQEIARNEGYAALVCTDVLDNTAQRKTLEANGFKDIFMVDNKRTGNRVAISVKELL